jgi:hypothetical protein
MSKAQDWYLWGSVLKHSEGGMTQKDIKYVAECCGVEVRFRSGPYVGQWGILVWTHDKRKLRRLGRELGIG